eukprot:GFUD01035950.1.p1 GENE.GFUD01035950.1~~GFUD01035950.1.p1  ORF type:complete len:521 (-),score=149.13 GFUD01035950.1:312-1874(-)
MGDKNDMEDMPGEERKTWVVRVKESYQQQTSSVWRPEYTVHTMWGPFLVMGCVMLVLGGGLLYVQGGYNEVEWDYTDCICQGSGMNATDYLQTSKASVCGPEDVTVSGDKYGTDFPVESLLTHQDFEVWNGSHANYWAGPNKRAGTFILNLGCRQTFRGIRLVNTHDFTWKAGATRQFKLHVSDTKSGPWAQVLDTQLEDSRQQKDPLPLQNFALDTETTAQFLKFELVSWWGDYGGLQYFDIERQIGPCRCIKVVNITEENNQAKWDRDILLYYGLDNFHQNHRQYADSRDDKQLNGDRLKSDGFPDLPFSDCEDPHNNDNSSGETLPIVPCGSIANSLFNDTVKLFFKKDNSNQWNPVSLLRTGIAMPFDKKRFNNPVEDSQLSTELEGKIAKPRDWTKQLWELDPDNPSNNGLENEDLIVWMRVSALANFRKLWRRVDHDDKKHTELKDGLNTAYLYKLEIEYNYDVSSFNGRKKVIIARDNEFGAKNTAMGWIAISAAIFFFSFGFLFSALTRLDQ